MKSRKILLTLVIIAGICIAAAAFMQGRLFKVKNIELFSEGYMFENKYISDISGIAINQNIFDINEETVMANINSTGEYCYDSMVVLYPSTVKISLHKRIPAALIEYENGYLLIDKDGYLIKRITTSSEYNLPIFTGIRLSQFNVGNQISTADTYQRSIMLTTIDSLSKTDSAKFISTISVENFSEIYIICKNGKRIDLCEAVDVANKLSLLSEAKLRELIFDSEEHTITLYNGYFAVS